jgi:hypothetical protein
MLNKKINFLSFDEYAVRETELYIPAIPIAANLYTNTGYRFRRNYFDRND